MSQDYPAQKAQGCYEQFNTLKVLFEARVPIHVRASFISTLETLFKKGAKLEDSWSFYPYSAVLEVVILALKTPSKNYKIKLAS